MKTRSQFIKIKLNRMLLSAMFIFSLGVIGVQPLAAQSAPAESLEKASSRSISQQDDDVDENASASDEEDEMRARYAQFEEMLSGSTLVGTFTINGRDLDPQTEEYEIIEVRKLPRGDYWQFKAQIRYADRDYELPIPLEVKWADDTPMITLTDLTFLGQGPFSARILFYDGMYAGTWAHGDVGGHMFGQIKKDGDDDGKSEGNTADDDDDDR